MPSPDSESAPDAAARPEDGAELIPNQAKASSRRVVPEVGLEPTRDHLSRDFESRVSANFTTPARGVSLTWTTLFAKRGETYFSAVSTTTTVNLSMLRSKLSVSAIP